MTKVLELMQQIEDLKHRRNTATWDGNTELRNIYINQILEFRERLETEVCKERTAKEEWDNQEPGVGY